MAGKTPVNQFTKDKKLVAEFDSVTEAAKQFKGVQCAKSGVWNAAAGCRKTYKGFIWRFKNEF